jgi:hypothetical protein
MKTIQMPVILKDFVNDEINRLLYVCHGQGLSAYLQSLRGQYLFKPREGYTDSFDKIIRVVGRYFDIIHYKLTQRTRKHEIVIARQIIYWFGRRYTGLSLQLMGNFFNQDHATVLHGISAVNNLIETDRVFASDIMQIDDRLNNGFPKYDLIEVKLPEMAEAI